MNRLDRYVFRAELRLFKGLGVSPWWYPGPAGWRWRLIMAYHALRGRELGGFTDGVLGFGGGPGVKRHRERLDDYIGDAS